MKEGAVSAAGVGWKENGWVMSSHLSQFSDTEPVKGLASGDTVSRGALGGGPVHAGPAPLGSFSLR